MKYTDYLKTGHWKALRQEVIEMHGGRCAACEARLPLEAHHIFYRKRWSDSIPIDLVALCAACHSVAHFEMRWTQDEKQGRRQLQTLLWKIQSLREGRRGRVKNPTHARGKRARGESAIREMIDNDLNVKLPPAPEPPVEPSVFPRPGMREVRRLPSPCPAWLPRNVRYTLP